MRNKFKLIFISLFIFSFFASAQNFNGGDDDGHTTANQANIDASSLREFGYITNVSSSNANGTYKIGDLISIEITFDRTIFVSGGTPQITLETGTIDQTATYSTGNDSKILTFSYTVQEGDNSSDLSYISTNIALGTATLTDILGHNVNITLPVSGNPGSLSVNKDIIVDGIKPIGTIDLATGQTDPTNNTTINYSLDFTEPVTGLILDDFTLFGTAGANTINVSGSGASYTIAVSGMTTDGSVILGLTQGQVNDIAGNPNGETILTHNTVNYDATKPTVEITQAAGQTDPTNSSPINFTATFSENVTGFDNADITLSGTANPTTAVVTGSGSTYNIAISGITADGTVIVDIAADVCIDTVGNFNTASLNTDNIVNYDATRPSVEITQASGQTDPTNSSPINFTATFSENVTGFDNADITLSGTANPTTAVVTGSGSTYNIAISGMTADGTIIVDIAADVCTDTVGNLNTASTNTDNEIVFDGTKPSIIVSSTESGSTELSNIPVTIEFSEQVQGFTLSDINLNNTNISGFTEVSTGQKWTASLNPVNQGDINISINADIAIDVANNGNTASNIFTIRYVLANQAPTIQNQQFSINEDSDAGTLIGTVIATDVNNDDINFEIISGNTDDAFSIDFNNGEISLNSSNILNYEKKTEYLLTVQVTDDSPDALSAQADINIKIIDIDEPFVANNIITPNDIRNKYWIIENIHNYTDFELTIRTATGQVVYKILNYQNDWAGTYNNKDLPTGTYYYTLVSTINKKSYSGYINLIRN